MTTRQRGKFGPPPQPRIGGPLRDLLDARFLTHRDLALALGTTEQQVSRWVRNETGPYRGTLRRIAAFFDVAPAELLDPDQERRAA